MTYYVDAAFLHTFMFSQIPLRVAPVGDSHTCGNSKIDVALTYAGADAFGHPWVSCAYQYVSSVCPTEHGLPKYDDVRLWLVSGYIL